MSIVNILLTVVVLVAAIGAIVYYTKKKDKEPVEEEIVKEDKTYEFNGIDIEEVRNVLKTYFDKYYDASFDKDTWFNKMKEAAEEMGYCANMKEYKLNPNNYKGSIADFSMIIRVALTTKTTTPDLYEIMKLLGTDRIKERIALI